MDNRSNHPKRWVVAVAGVLVQLVLGSVYAWSVFKRPLMDAHGWTGPQVGLTFTIVIFCLGTAAAFGGRFVDRAGARRVATLAAVLFGLGTMGAGLADRTGSLGLLYICYGVIAGLGNGLGYVTPIAVLVRWFPDRRGLITGVAVMGFGFGASITGQVAPLLILSLGLGRTFLLFGVIFLAVLLAAARRLDNPPEGWRPPPAAGRNKEPDAVPVSLTLREALHLPQFYMLWIIFTFNISAGIALLSNLSPMAQEQIGVTAVGAGTVIFAGSLFNGFGRIFWASLSDRLGRKAVFLIILATQIPVFLLLPGVTGAVPFAAMCCYILFCYGGGFGTMPAFVADTFGTRHMGAIYGKVLLAWSAAGVIGPLAMEAIRKASGGFKGAFYITACFLALGLISAACYRRPSRTD